MALIISRIGCRWLLNLSSFLGPCSFSSCIITGAIVVVVSVKHIATTGTIIVIARSRTIIVIIIITIKSIPATISYSVIITISLTIVIIISSSKISVTTWKIVTVTTIIISTDRIAIIVRAISITVETFKFMRGKIVVVIATIYTRTINRHFISSESALPGADASRKRTGLIRPAYLSASRLPVPVRYTFLL